MTTPLLFCPNEYHQLREEAHKHGGVAATDGETKADEYRQGHKISNPSQHIRAFGKVTKLLCGEETEALDLI